MGGSLARWILLVTAAALVLLGRPLDRPIATRSDDDRAGCSTSDELALSSSRRDTPSLRMTEVGTERGSLSLALAPEHAFDVLSASVRISAYVAASRQMGRFDRPSAISARGPPSSQA